MAVLCGAARVGTYSIVTLVNGAASGNTTHPAIAGGMQWYVDQVLGNNTYGSGGSYNLFYTDAKVKQVPASNPSAACNSSFWHQMGILYIKRFVFRYLLKQQWLGPTHDNFCCFYATLPPHGMLDGSCLHYAKPLACAA